MRRTLAATFTRRGHSLSVRSLQKILKMDSFTIHSNLFLLFSLPLSLFLSLFLGLFFVFGGFFGGFFFFWQTIIPWAGLNSWPSASAPEHLDYRCMPLCFAGHFLYTENSKLQPTFFLFPLVVWLWSGSIIKHSFVTWIQNSAVSKEAGIGRSFCPANDISSLIHQKLHPAPRSNAGSFVDGPTLVLLQEPFLKFHLWLLFT